MLAVVGVESDRSKRKPAVVGGCVFVVVEVVEVEVKDSFVGGWWVVMSAGVRTIHLVRLFVVIHLFEITAAISCSASEENNSASSQCRRIYISETHTLRGDSPFSRVGITAG